MDKIRAFTAILALTILLCSIPSQGYSQATTSNGLQWLTSVQQTEGSWGGWSTPVLRDTTVTADAFQLLDSSSPAYSLTLQWLTAANLMNNDDAARRIYTLSRTNNDITSDLNSLIAARKSDGGWGLDAENESGIINTALALQALKATNYTDYSVLYQAISFLTSNQNSDGGWGFYAGDESNAYITAMVLRTLASYNNVTFNVQTNINNASAYLLTKQNPDGGFGSSPSTIYETALSVMSLIESGQGSALPLQNAINYLTSAQSSNGSWSDDPYSTALALQALAAARANLTVSSISLSKSMPRENEETTITATINNTGYEDASSITVRFYLGDPASGGVQLGTDQVIPSLALGSSSQVAITQSFTGGKTICRRKMDINFEHMNT